jgi:hypothetical protein
MIPVGYMAKHVLVQPEMLKAAGIENIFSVNGCVSKYFADTIHFWQHNGYWLFNSIEILKSLVARA